MSKSKVTLCIFFVSAFSGLFAAADPTFLNRYPVPWWAAAKFIPHGTGTVLERLAIPGRQ